MTLIKVNNRKKEFLILAALALALLLSISVFLFINYTEQNISLQTQSSETIGVAFNVKGKVLYRDSQSLDWFEINKDSPLHPKQFLFTNENSRAEYVFVDDSIVVQSPDTLLAVNSKFDLLGTLSKQEGAKNVKNKVGNNSFELDLVDGEILVSMSKNGKLRSVKTNIATISPETEESSEFIVVNKTNEMTVDVIKGQVNVSGDKLNKSVMERESFNVKRSGTEKFSSVSDEKVDKYRNYQVEAKRESKDRMKERKGFEDFLKDIVSIFLPFLE